MATATSNSMGVVNFATGVFTGAGAIVEVDLGFTPRWVKIFNETDVIMWELFECMSDTITAKTVTAGTTTADTTTAITVDTDGFSVTAAAAVEDSVLSWVAMA